MNSKTVNRILQQNRDIYNYIADDFSNTRNIWWRGYDNLSKFVKSGDRVLDLGCGNGRMAKIFTRSKIKYLGLDNSQALIKIAKNEFKNNNNFNFQLGDIIDLNLPNNKFDLVLLIAVLHHLPTKKLRRKVLQAVYKTLKPGGCLVVANWNLWSKMMRGKLRRRLFHFFAKWSRGVWRLNDAFIPWQTKEKKQYRYVHSFTKGELKRLLKSAGLAVEEINYESKGQKAGILVGGNLLAIARKK